MAYTVNPMDEEENGTPQINTSSQPTTITGNAESSAQNKAQTAQNRAGTFQNIQKYIQANKPAAGAMGQQVASQVKQQAGNITAKAGEKSKQVQSDVADKEKMITSTAGQAKELITNAASGNLGAENIVDTTSDSYKTLQDLYKTYDYKPYDYSGDMLQANRLVGQGKELTKGGTSAEQFLRSQYGNEGYTKGESKLDSALLGQGAVASRLRENVQAATSQLPKAVQQYNIQDQARIAAAKALANKGRAEFKEGVNLAQEDLVDRLENERTAAQAETTALMKKLGLGGIKDTSYGSAYDPTLNTYTTEDIVNLIGNEGYNPNSQYDTGRLSIKNPELQKIFGINNDLLDTYGVDPSQYLQYTGPKDGYKLEDFASQKDIDAALALSQLMGGKEVSPAVLQEGIEKAKYGAEAFTLDPKYFADVEANKQAMLDRIKQESEGYVKSQQDLYNQGQYDKSLTYAQYYNPNNPFNDMYSPEQMAEFKRLMDNGFIDYKPYNPHTSGGGGDSTDSSDSGDSGGSSADASAGTSV